MSWSFRAGAFRAWTFRAASLAGALEEAAQGGGVGSGSGRKRKPVYIERDGKLLLFRNAYDAAQFVAQEKAAAEPQKAQRKATSKPVARRDTFEPYETIDVPQIRALAALYHSTENIDRLISLEDFATLLRIQVALRNRDDEEIALAILLAMP